VEERADGLVQLTPLPPVISCFIKIENTDLLPSGREAVDVVAVRLCSACCFERQRDKVRIQKYPVRISAAAKNVATPYDRMHRSYLKGR